MNILFPLLYYAEFQFAVWRTKGLDPSDLVYQKSACAWPANSFLSVYCAFQILCLVGEGFENSDQVCGAVVNIRNKGDKIGK